MDCLTLFLIFKAALICFKMSVEQDFSLILKFALPNFSAIFNSCSHEFYVFLQPISTKVAQIAEIWQEKLGVVTLHIFQNVIPVEAYTREACMIEALGVLSPSLPCVLHECQ